MFVLQSSTFAQELAWTEVTKKADWRPRDSCGEWAYNGKLWLLGGWFQSFEDPPRDVWSSTDGATWKLEAKDVPIKHTDLAMTITFKNKMWMMGGWHGGRLKHASASSEVWSSTDGINWKQETKDAGWSPRLAAALAVHQNKLWLLGGVQKYYFGDDNDLKCDVWYTEDGITWKEATPKAPWTPRAYHQAVALNGKLYLFGGGNYLPKYAAHNDVWSSADGVNWTQETEQAPWHPRCWFSGEVYRDRMWVLGGWSNKPSKNWNDVWHSKDGKNWTELKTKTVFSPRHEHSTYVLHDKLWVAAGMTPPLQNNVWSLHIPEDYFKDAK